MNRPIATLCLLLLTAACNTPPRPVDLDPAIRGEVRDALAGRQDGAAGRAPDLTLLPPLRMEMPQVEGRPIDPRFDLSVNNAPAPQVFMSIVSGTRYSMLLNPEVTGNISVHLKDVTVAEALDSLRELYGYEYRMDGTRIFVQPAGLQTRIFRVNYLVGQRKGSSELRVQSGSLADTSTPVGAPAQATAAAPQPPVPGTQTFGGGTNRSLDSTRISTTTLSDFWSELRAALTSIIGASGGRNVIVTPHSGLVVVRAFPEELRAVEQYLRETRLSIERQVMLEAKVIEVTLSDDFQSGINWALFRTNASPRGAFGQLSNNTTLGTSGGSATINSPPLTANPGLGTIAAATTQASTTGAAVFGIAVQSSNFAALLAFLDSQGTTQVLSSPRIATLNNQKAVLKVGTDEFFVTNVATVTTTTGTTTQQTPTVTVAPFFSGIMLDVTPQIDDGTSITLHVHPSISTVTENPTVVDLGGTIPSITLPLPKSAVNESDTVVRVTDGNIVAIGGLMSMGRRDSRTGIPGIADANPLFRNTDNQLRKREIVILIKPTIIQGDATWGQDLRDTQQRLERFIPLRPAPDAKPQ
jgi:MSHA biogenesis protein MshL